MSCTRRQFITRVGALAVVSGMAGRVVANTLNINGVRYGMVHDESLCIAARPAWMPVGKSTTCRKAYRA
ncbi:formate-dependent nitrite reductase subunit NrfC [Salmonella enterica subsp. enterica]|nr:formate-dependent nitrite reductase subunit NrfC [Salmonella enterica subsp. enterica]